MKNICSKFMIFLFILCAWTTPSNAQSTRVVTKIDGFGQIANVWQTTDPFNYLSKIQGTYGNISPSVVDLTSTSIEHATDPRIAASSDGSASTRAAAVWKAFDISTFNYIVQATIATSGGWVTSPTTLSLNDGSELPLDDVRLDISADGSLINVIWSAYDTVSGNTNTRAQISTDGGSTWSGEIIY